MTRKTRHSASPHQQNRRHRTFSVEALEDRRLMAFGWNQVNVPNGPAGDSIDFLTSMPGGELSEFKLLNTDGTVTSGRPKYASDSEPVGGTLSPYKNTPPNFHDFRMVLPEAATGFQALVISANESFQLRPYQNNGSDPPLFLNADEDCYDYNTQQNVPTCIGGGTTPRLYTVLDMPANYFDGMDLNITNGTATSAGPEEFDRFAYFVPGAQAIASGGSTVVSESGTTDTIRLRLRGGLLRPFIPFADGNENRNVVFDIQSLDTSELEVLTPQIVLNDANWNVGLDIVVRGVDDGLLDGDQTVQLSITVNDALSSRLFQPYGDSIETVIVTDNDNAVSIAMPGSSVLPEDGAGTFDFTLSRTGDLSSFVVVPFIFGGSGIYGDDFDVIGANTLSPIGGSAVFAPGVSTLTLRFDPIADGWLELDETIIVTFQDGPMHQIVSPRTYTKTIQNDDPHPDGDFNDDGNYDCADVDDLVDKISRGITQPKYDLTLDRMVNLFDLAAWLAEAGEHNLGPGRFYRQGDVNLDGIVDGSDFVIWNAHKFTVTRRWCHGDLNADGVTDGGDFTIWNSNKFTSTFSAVLVSQGLGAAAYTASGTNGETPDRAFDGTTTTAWNAGGFPIQWIEVDLQQPRVISNLVLTVLQSPPGVTVHEIRVSNSPIQGNASSGFLLHTSSMLTFSGDRLRLAVIPVEARYVQIRTVSSPSWVAWSEIQVFATSPAAIHLRNIDDSQFAIVHAMASDVSTSDRGNENESVSVRLLGDVQSLDEARHTLDATTHGDSATSRTCYQRRKPAPTQSIDDYFARRQSIADLIDSTLLNDDVGVMATV